MIGRLYRKWDYKSHRYKPYLVPEDKYLTTYEEDMEKIVNCCQCFKELPFGKAYTSLEVQTEPLGFGYAVCAECHEKEIERARKNGKWG